MVIRSWGWGLMSGTSVLIKQAPQSSLDLPPGKDAGRGQQSATRRPSSNHAGTVISYSQPP